MSGLFVLRARRTAHGFRLRVEGEATLRRHPALLELFIVQILDRTPCSVVVDLTACERLDDRFYSALSDLDRHYGWSGARRFTMFTRVRDALLADDDMGDDVELPPMEPGAIDLESHLMGWHRLLAQLVDPGEDADERDHEPAAELACR